MQGFLFAYFCQIIKDCFLWQRDEAVKVFEHFVGKGLKPNATTYSLLIDAHLVKRDPKAALSVVDEMVYINVSPY